MFGAHQRAHIAPNDQIALKLAAPGVVRRCLHVQVNPLGYLQRYLARTGAQRQQRSQKFGGSRADPLQRFADPVGACARQQIQRSAIQINNALLNIHHDQPIPHGVHQHVLANRQNVQHLVAEETDRKEDAGQGEQHRGGIQVGESENAEHAQHVGDQRHTDTRQHPGGLFAKQAGALGESLTGKQEQCKQEQRVGVDHIDPKPSTALEDARGTWLAQPSIKQVVQRVAPQQDQGQNRLNDQQQQRGAIDPAPPPADLAGKDEYVDRHAQHAKVGHIQPEVRKGLVGEQPEQRIRPRPDGQMQQQNEQRQTTRRTPPRPCQNRNCQANTAGNKQVKRVQQGGVCHHSPSKTGKQARRALRSTWTVLTVAAAMGAKTPGQECF